MQKVIWFGSACVIAASLFSGCSAQAACPQSSAKFNAQETFVGRVFDKTLNAYFLGYQASIVSQCPIDIGGTNYYVTYTQLTPHYQSADAFAEALKEEKACDLDGGACLQGVAGWQTSYSYVIVQN